MLDIISQSCMWVYAGGCLTGETHASHGEHQADVLHVDCCECGGCGDFGKENALGCNAVSIWQGLRCNDEPPHPGSQLLFQCLPAVRRGDNKHQK